MYERPPVVELDRLCDLEQAFNTFAAQHSHLDSVQTSSYPFTMAAQVLQSVDPAHPSLDPNPQPGPSRTATVADESDEVAAEAGTATTNGANGTNGTSGSNGDAVKAEETKANGDADEAEEDPDAIPRNACETLYIQNLNEKVQIPGECGDLSLREYLFGGKRQRQDEMEGVDG